MVGIGGCPSASMTMSASSSLVDVVGFGVGVGVGGLAFANPIGITESPSSTIALDTTCRICTPLAPDLVDVNRSPQAYRGLTLQAWVESWTKTAPTKGRNPRVLKGFKEFLARGNIVDLSIAVVIGTAFTGLVTKFTESIVQPLIDGVGAGKDANYGILRIPIYGGQTIDLNVLLSAAINFLLVAAVVYFLVVVPYNRLRKKGEVEQAQDTELSLLTEIRDLMAAEAGVAKQTTGPGTGPSPDTAETTSADKD